MTIFHKDELDEYLQDKLSRIESTKSRNPDKAARGREVFMDHVNELQTVTPSAVTTPPKQKSWLPLLGRRPSFASIAVALTLALILLFGSAWGAAYAAQDSLPNDFLYPVKVAGENIHLALTGSVEAKIELLSTYIERRTVEATGLASQGDAIPDSLPNRMEMQLDELLSQAAMLDGSAMTQALSGIQEQLRTQDREITRAMSGLPEDVDPQLTRLQAMLQARQQLVQMGLGDPNTFRHQYRHQEGKPTLPITTTVTTTITATLTTTPVITGTKTQGQYGPGPCQEPGACTPVGDSQGPGPHAGTPTPGSGQHGNQNKGEATPIHGDGYGPGPENNEDPLGTQSGPGEPPDDSSGPNPTKTPKPTNVKTNPNAGSKGEKQSTKTP